MALFKWDSFIEGLLSCESKQAAKQTFDILLQDQGLSKILYLDTQGADAEQVDETHFLDNFPTAWMDRYVSKGYFAYDPVIKQCRASANPVSWQDQRFTTKTPPKTQEIFSERIDFGLIQGITFPLHHVTHTPLAVLSLSTEHDDPDFDAFVTAHQDTLNLAGIFFHAALQTFPKTKVDIENYPELSNRQREVLYWVLAHKRSKEIADILNLSERTVSHHIGIAAKKLKAKSRYEAAAKAVKLGIIQP